MKQYFRYEMDFDGKAMRLSGICMGVSVFSLSVYYLFMQDIGAVPIFAQIVNLWIPLLLCVGYIVLMRVLRWNAPGMYAIFACLLCLDLFMSTVVGGGVLRILMSLVGYLFCGCMILFTAGGYLPGKLPAAGCFGIMLAVRLIFFDLGRISATAWIPEIGMLCILLALVCLPLSLKPRRK